MALTIRDLEYFIAIAEQRHFGKAAQVVGVSQPTLSMQFKKLEQRLGVNLIERLSRHATLTERGEEVVPIAREILRLASDFEQRCGASGSKARLRLGLIPTIAPYLLPRVTKSLGQLIQGRTTSFVEAHTAELIQLVKDGTIDIAVVSVPLHQRGLPEYELYFEPFYLAVHRAHPLAKRKKVSVDDFRDERVLLLGEGHCLREQALSICSRLKLPRDTDFSATSLETLRSMVRMGIGVTLMPKMATQRGDTLSYIPFADPTIGRSVGLLLRETSNEMELVRGLADMIKGAAQRIGITTLDSPKLLTTF